MNGTIIVIVVVIIEGTVYALGFLTGSELQHRRRLLRHRR